MKHYFFPRLITSLLGLFIMTIGIALSCIADLGTSPISSVPWVISMFTGWTVGEITIAMNFVMVAVQPLLLREFYWRELALQTVTTIFFGQGIDLSMRLFACVKTDSLIGQWLICLAGIVVLALGVFMAVNARVFIAAGEGCVNVIAFVSKCKFSIIKNCFDIGLVLISVGLSFWQFGYLKGVGLGTIVAAVGVGRCVQFYANHLHFFEKWHQK